MFDFFKSITCVNLVKPYHQKYYILPLYKAFRQIIYLSMCQTNMTNFAAEKAKLLKISELTTFPFN